MCVCGGGGGGGSKAFSPRSPMSGHGPRYENLCNENCRTDKLADVLWLSEASKKLFR